MKRIKRHNPFHDKLNNFILKKESVRERYSNPTERHGMIEDYFTVIFDPIYTIRIPPNYASS